MIQLLRVDHRLIHGQVVMSWMRSLEPTAILVANDSVPNDELRKSTLKMAKPTDVKLVIKTVADSIEAINSGKTDSYKLFILTESVEDAGSAPPSATSTSAARSACRARHRSPTPST